MSGIGDFVKDSLKTAKPRTEGLAEDMKKNAPFRGNPLKKGLTFGGLVNPKRDWKFFEEDSNRLFIGKPMEPSKPEAAAPTLKAVDDQTTTQATRKRRASSVLTAEPLSRKSVLGD